MSDENDESTVPKVIKSGRDVLRGVFAPAKQAKKSWMTEGQHAALQVFLMALEGMKKPDVEGMAEAFRALDAQGRKEAVALLGLLEQLAHPTIGIALKIATDQGDKFAIPSSDGTGTNIWLGDEEDPPEGSEHTENCDGVLALDKPQLSSLPPMLANKIKKKLSKQLGIPEEHLKVIGMGHTDMGEIDMGDGETIPRLQDSYEDDPIERLARDLDRLPKGKRPRLAPKKLPEC